MKRREGIVMLLACSLAGCGTPYWRAEKAYELGDYASAYNLFTALAPSDQRAETQLGYMYEFGDGVPPDYRQAAAWFAKAADQHDANAELELGYFYQMGYGVEPDQATAHRLYLRAATQKLAAAENNVGNDYLSGLGVSVDYSMALQWFRRAGDDDSPIAMANLGYMYLNGLGVTADQAAAVDWYTKAASHSYRPAQLFLARSYRDGAYGLRQSAPEADTLFKLAASDTVRTVEEMRSWMAAIIDAHKYYPADAAAQHETGRVKVSFDCPDRVPENVTVTESSGHPALDAAARDAVSQALFSPRTQRLKAVQHFEIYVNFYEPEWRPSVPGSMYAADTQSLIWLPSKVGNPTVEVAFD